jgi:protein-L-isoaspartate(D-aspartate) O-methyltransferase
MRRKRPPVQAAWQKEWPEIYDGRVRAAFERVPRAEFVDEEVRPWATADIALPIDEGQTISQPFVVALMTQALGLEPGTKILEIGTGSGYQTAILCELTAQPGQRLGSTIWSVERHGALAEAARARLARLGYFPQITVGDGAAGWAEAGPYAAIVVTAGATAVPRPLWDQLAEGGRMVIPVGPMDDEQELWRLLKEEGRMVQARLGPVRFVPLLSPILDDPQQRIHLPNSFGRSKDF